MSQPSEKIPIYTRVGKRCAFNCHTMKIAVLLFSLLVLAGSLYALPVHPEYAMEEIEDIPPMLSHGGNEVVSEENAQLVRERRSPFQQSGYFPQTNPGGYNFPQPNREGYYFPQTNPGGYNFPQPNREGYNFPQPNREGYNFPQSNREGYNFPQPNRGGYTFPQPNREGYNFPQPSPPRGSISGGVFREKGVGTIAHVKGERNLWTSRNGKGRLDAQGQWMKVIKGPARGKPSYSIGLSYVHRF